MERFNDISKGEYRIHNHTWQSCVHINIAKTGIRFWIEIDEATTSDRNIIFGKTTGISYLRAVAGRLKSATRNVCNPIRSRCEELDMIAETSVPDDDLVYVKTAFRQLEITTPIPDAIMAIIASTHKKALAKSISLSELSNNPNDLSNIVRLGKSSMSKRRVIAMIGPTNSGKTHRALEKLKSAPTGAYLGPLRLMAMEGYDRLESYGLAVEMRTGEETIEVSNPTHLSATIEMAETERHFHTVVIDEAQLLDNSQRGWAWTRAMFYSDCHTLILTGSPDCLPIAKRICEITGETLEIINFERRAPLAAAEKITEISELKAGDAVIAFSRTNVLAMKSEISRCVNPDTGKPFRVATIYGALGPEVRRTEAKRFSNGEAEILVATDAIGMGLNLPIDRVLFSTLVKYDGRISRQLSDSEIRQIGGRAGRHGQDGGGVVGLLRGAGCSIDPIEHALTAKLESSGDARPYIWPSIRQIIKGMEALEIETLSKALPAVSSILRNSPDYRCQIDPDTIDLLQTIEQYELSLEDKHDWIGCPIPLREQTNRRAVEYWASCQQNGLPVRSPKISYQTDLQIDDHRLKEIEQTVVQAGAYLWLSRRWPDIYEDIENAVSTRRDGNRMIEDALRQRQINRNCVGCKKPIGYRVRRNTCPSCTYD